MSRTAEQLFEIASRKSKREAVYHMLLRRIVSEYAERENPLYCEHCARFVKHNLILRVHADECPISLAEIALEADADQIAAMLEAMATINPPAD